ncbi:MAG: hypothetical protein J7K62_02390 [Thermoplasmata archaeon]|nr:hypothetical protein [Thermoplasmata archaeon]
MSGEFYNRVNREFWLFLRNQGFPEGIDDKAIQRETLRIENAAAYGKRLRLRNWRWVDGAQHSDDVALVSLLADRLGLEQGRDWDWSLEDDNYHMDIAFSGRPKVRRLQQLIDLYHRAELVRLEVFSQIPPSKAKEISDEELQHMLHEAWKRVEKERKRQMEELEKFAEEIVKGLKEMGLK